MKCNNCGYEHGRVPEKLDVVEGVHGEFLIDERGELIPAYICICFARDKFECGCGAWDRDIDHGQDALDG